MNLKVRITAYAIKHLPSGGFLPTRTNGRGFSYDEPELYSVPRLFPDRKSAQCALSAWLRGRWEPNTAIDWETGYGETYWEPKKQGHRKPEDMEVVEIEIKETNP